jgi:hypothetical protein
MTSKRNSFDPGTAPPMHAHSTPDPETPPSNPTPTPPPTPDDEPLPSHAPVEEPRMPEPPIRAG